MDGDLNLLPSRAKFQIKRTVLKKKISSFLWVFGGFWVLLLVVVLGLFFISQMILKNYDKDYSRGLEQYKNLLGSMVINQQVKYQAKVVGKVLEKRFEYGNSIESVRSLFSENIKVDDIEIKSKKEFSLAGNFSDGKLMDEVEEKVVLINQGQLEGFREAKLSSVKINTDGWSFEMEVFLE
jgi:hypothetical protein